MRTWSDEANDDDEEEDEEEDDEEEGEEEDEEEGEEEDEEEEGEEEDEEVVVEKEEERGLVVPISSWVKHLCSVGDAWYRNADNDSMRVMYLLIVLLLFVDNYAGILSWWRR